MTGPAGAQTAGLPEDWASIGQIPVDFRLHRTRFTISHWSFHPIDTRQSLALVKQVYFASFLAVLGLDFRNGKKQGDRLEYQTFIFDARPHLHRADWRGSSGPE